jgi:hypothetical protein
MAQANLFDTGDKLPAHCQSQLARASDPPTSQQAAGELAGSKLGHCQQKFVNALASLGKPSTAAEIAELAYIQDSSSNRERAGELVRAGKIFEHPPRRCDVTGKQATRYWVKPPTAA